MHSITKPVHSHRFSATLFRLLGAASLVAAPCIAGAADVAHPTVVELFQSQGCSSCPPANANVLALADRPEILVLSWQVTYWDDLGWQDTFGKPAFTERQWDYAHAFRRNQVGTPEVVVNGREDVVGTDREELEALIARADRGPASPTVALEGQRVTVSGQGPASNVVLVRFNPNIVQVPIQRGENHGRTLPHKNVVREVKVLGQWKGGDRAFDLPASQNDGLKTAVLLQSGTGGPIIAAAREP